MVYNIFHVICVPFLKFNINMAAKINYMGGMFLHDSVQSLTCQSKIQNGHHAVQSFSIGHSWKMKYTPFPNNTKTYFHLNNS